MHALTGVVIAVILICYVLSGMTWTRYWGENWRAVTATVTPSTEIDAPSTPAKLGDYDRLGRRIAWAATDDPIYASQPDGAGGAPLSYADIDRIAKDEHMVPGYSIIPPSDSTADGATVYGSYTVVNRWPQRLSEQRTLYLNQFTGATITNATAAQDGALSRLTSFGIAMHMGNQLGWLTRISATVACLGVLTQRADRSSDVVEAPPGRRQRAARPGQRGDPRQHPEAGDGHGGGHRGRTRSAVPGVRNLTDRGACRRGDHLRTANTHATPKPLCCR